MHGLLQMNEASVREASKQQQDLGLGCYCLVDEGPCAAMHLCPSTWNIHDAHWEVWRGFFSPLQSKSIPRGFTGSAELRFGQMWTLNPVIQIIATSHVTVSFSVVIAFDLTTFEREPEIGEVKMLWHDKKLQSSWRICKCGWVLGCVLYTDCKNTSHFYPFIFMFFLKAFWNEGCLEIFSSAFARSSPPITKKCLSLFLCVWSSNRLLLPLWRGSHWLA